jgi:predicted AlkP superfamily phosphohydrolase/phosphomutase
MDFAQAVGDPCPVLAATSPSVLVIGLDCLSPELVFDRYREQLPTFAALMRDGTWGPLASSDPPITIPAWACMMTGVPASRLGLYGFRHRRLGSYSEKYSANATHVRVPRVWDTLSIAGRSVGVLGVPQTWPPVPVNGYLVSDAPPTGHAGFTFPAELEAEIEQDGGRYQFDVEGFRMADPDRVLDAIQTITRQRFELFRRLLTTRGGEFQMMVDMGTDRMHHIFFRHCDSTHPRHRPGHRHNGVMLAYYRLLDVELARTLQLVPANCQVLVVSDHGAQPMLGGFCLNDWLIASGWLTLKQPATSVRDFHEGLVDWSHTRAWAWGGHCGRIFLNLRGREPEGIVPPSDAPVLLDKIARRLESLPDSAGRPMGNRVLRIGGPELPHPIGDHPDALVYLGDMRWRALGSIGHRDWFQAENDTGADDASHHQMGVFIHRGPAGGQGQRMGLRLYDVAPTILSWFGLAPVDDCVGRVLEL